MFFVLPNSTLILGCSLPVAPDRPCWGQCEQVPQIFGREIIFEVF